nr:hypothetical protein [uncultured Desulfobacter sp.]
MRTKIGVLIVGVVFLFAMVLAGCGDQDKSNQAPIAPQAEVTVPEAEVTVPEAEVTAPEDEAAPPEVEETDPEVQAEKMAPKTDTESQEASAPEKE